MVDCGYLKWQLRRGKLELDVILQRFVARYPLEQMDENDRQLLDGLLRKSDEDLLELILGRSVAEKVAEGRLLEKISAAAGNSA